MSTRGDRVDPDQVEITLTWGERLVYTMLYPLAQVIAPAFTFGLMARFCWRAFDGGLGDGVRSFAAELLPLLLVTYLTASRRWGDRLALVAGAVPIWATFSGMLVVGALLLPVISLSTAVPVAELVLSSCFSLLVGGLVLSADREKAMAYYFGFVLGVVGAVVGTGLPSF
jgi:hypothetical protein